VQTARSAILSSRIDASYLEGEIIPLDRGSRAHDASVGADWGGGLAVIECDKSSTGRCAGGLTEGYPRGVDHDLIFDAIELFVEGTAVPVGTQEVP